MLVLVVVALAACGSDDPESGAGPTATEPSELPPPPSVPTDTETPLGEQADHAIADLAERAGVDAEAVTVVTSERVTWRDGSLGCPEEGRVYTQALVEGYRLVLQADGEEAAYHGRTGEPPTFCPQPAADGAVTD